MPCMRHSSAHVPLHALCMCGRAGGMLRSWHALQHAGTHAVLSARMCGGICAGGEGVHLQHVSHAAQELSGEQLCGTLWAAALLDCSTWRHWRSFTHALASRADTVCLPNALPAPPHLHTCSASCHRCPLMQAVAVT